MASSVVSVLAALLWLAPAGAVDIYNNESQRLRRVVGFSDIAVLATVSQIDTFSFRDQVGEPAIGTRVMLQVERQLLGQPTAAELPIKGPDVLSEKSERNPLEDPLTAIDTTTGIRPGARGIYLLHADPKNRCWALTPGGVFLVENDTIVIESRWAGRRWLQNIALPLVQDGVDVGSHITVDDMARWLSLVDQKRMFAVGRGLGTLVVDGVLMQYIPMCNVPPDMRCFRVGVNRVISVDRDSVARSDVARQASPHNEDGVALDHASGARDGQAIKVMLPGFFLDWQGSRVVLLLEPGPTGSNIWVPALDGFGAQPIVGSVMARCNMPLQVR